MMLNSENLLLSRRVLLSNYLSFSSYFLMLLKSPRIASEPADSRNIVNFKKYARPSQVSTSRVRIHFFLSLYFDPFLQCLLHRLSPKRMICMRESKALFLSSSKGKWRLQNLFLGICFWDAKKGQGTFHFYSDPPLWMSTLRRQLVGIRFQRDRQKDQRVPTKKWGGRNLLIHRGGSEKKWNVPSVHVTAGVMVQCFIPENCHYLV